MGENETDSQRDERVNQSQVYELITGEDVSWQEIIYDLINTEQLEPWDIDISILTEKYLEKIRQLEEADFFVSSKVLLAAALLLRIKSEILVNKYIKNIDEILFGKKEIKQVPFEKIELDEEIPQLIPRSPIPRLKKVTLQELIEALNKAINTENKRIKKEITAKNALRESSFSLPRKKLSIKDKITEIYKKISFHFEKNKEDKKISFSDFAGNDKEEKIISFLPLLHLEDQKKVWLEQEKHFDEIYIWLKEVYFQSNPDPFADLKQELKDESEEIEEEKTEKVEE